MPTSLCSFQCPALKFWALPGSCAPLLCIYIMYVCWLSQRLLHHCLACQPLLCVAHDPDDHNCGPQSWCTFKVVSYYVAIRHPAHTYDFPHTICHPFNMVRLVQRGLPQSVVAAVAWREVSQRRPISSVVADLTGAGLIITALRTSYAFVNMPFSE